MFDTTLHFETVQVGETRNIGHPQLIRILQACHRVGMRLVTDEADRRLGWHVLASQDGTQVLIIEASQGRV